MPGKLAWNVGGWANELVSNCYDSSLSTQDDTNWAVSAMALKHRARMVHPPGRRDVDPRNGSKEDHEMSKNSAFRKVALSLAAGLAVVTATHHAHAAGTDQEKAAANFQLADANSDNALSKSEFMTFIDLNAAAKLGRAGLVKKNRLYDTAFSRADANGDGAVTRAEMSEIGN
jgi:hypothetical protein